MPIWFAKRGSNGDKPGPASGLQGDLTQQLRLWSGLVLMAYAASHLANHAVGLLSLADMELVRLYFIGFWRSDPGTIAMAGALVIHVAMAFLKLAQTRTWRMPVWQAAQIVLGLAIPLTLAEHLVGTRIVHEVYGMDDRYALVLLASWTDKNWGMAILIGTVWIHGCIGIHFWARLYRGYHRIRLWLFSVALLLPVLAYTGYASAGREVAALRASDPLWVANLLRDIGFPGRHVLQFVQQGEAIAHYSLFGAIAALVLFQFLRFVLSRRNTVTLTYVGRQTYRVPRGLSILEASRRNGVPHAAVCGGRGRCSTCRVRVGAGLGQLTPAGDLEQKVLRRIGAPPNVRLACQVPVSTPLEVSPLLPPSSSPSVMAADGGNRHGRERELAVLFSDIRSFTRFSEEKLPFDVVFVLNQYFRAMSTVVQSNGGYVDKYIGDGLMALFGLESDRETAARQAIESARAMSRELTRLNEDLSDELSEPLRIGIGIHLGQVIVGEIGHGTAASLTAIGDTVNVASRLEAMTKEFASELVISDDLARAAGIDAGAMQHADLPIRGRTQPLSAAVFPKGSDLPDAG